MKDAVEGSNFYVHEVKPYKEIPKEFEFAIRKTYDRIFKFIELKDDEFFGVNSFRQGIYLYYTQSYNDAILYINKVINSNGLENWNIRINKLKFGSNQNHDYVDLFYDGKNLMVQNLIINED